MKVLDHGSVDFIESWGSDERVIEAARMSTGGGFKGWEPGVHNGKQHDGDAKLLRFLWKNHHMTPFEMGGLVLEVEAPLFIFREWHRHRTQSYNEMSARYIPLPNTNYLPTWERIKTGVEMAKQNRQAQGAVELNETMAMSWLDHLQRLYDHAQSVYEMGINAGVPKELARLPVPVARYSRMRVSANLRNWLQFLELRMAPGAQWEIREFANAVAFQVKNNFPRTFDLFIEKEAP